MGRGDMWQGPPLGKKKKKNLRRRTDERTDPSQTNPHITGLASKLDIYVVNYFHQVGGSNVCVTALGDVGRAKRPEITPEFFAVL